MEISCDKQKDILNQEKHGVSLALAHHLDCAEMLSYSDARRDYGEKRTIGYAPIGERVYCVVYTLRDAGCRIISLRKANSREVDYYESTINQQG